MMLAMRSVLAFAALAVPLVSGLSSMPPLTTTAELLPLAHKCMDYIDNSPDPFHAVQTSVDLLEEAGFEELVDTSPYTGRLVPGGKYYFSRNKSTLVAFCVGEKYQPGNGFKVIGGHTDSPNLKVKPRSKRRNAGVTQIAVECYGGGLWHTWFDRDLGSVDGCWFERTQDERAAFTINKEDHLSPIIAMEAEKALAGNDKKKKDESKDGWTEFQEPLLLQLLAAELGCEVSDIADFELNLYDIQRAAVGGAHSEFIHSARLDNLASCFLAVQALVEHVQDGSLANDEDVSLIALFDHEEVGSSSAVGAGSTIMGESVERIAAALNGGDGNADLYQSCIRRSFVLSVDQAHAVHPNYKSKHETGHSPKMNGGMVIKRNNNQRYATNGITGFLVRELAKKAGLPPVQEFLVRNDCACGSTIGPIISTATGIRAIDMGCPQLSMHSIRETMGVCDISNGLALFKAYFKLFREVDSSLEQ